MTVSDNDPDLARFVIVSADIDGAVMDNELGDAEPTLLLTLAKMEMAKAATTCALHETEESEVHDEACERLDPIETTKET